MFDLNNIWRKNALSRSLIRIFPSRFQDKHQTALRSQQGQADLMKWLLAGNMLICFTFSSRWGKSRKIVHIESGRETSTKRWQDGGEIDIALLKGDQEIEKKLRLLAGKIVPRKKVCCFEWCLVLSQKYTKSFGGNKFCYVQRIFSHRESRYMFDFWLDSVQNVQNFFLLGNPT